MLDETIQFDEQHARYTTHVSVEGRNSVADAVAMTVATVRDCDPTDLPPLGKTVDPDALNDIFTGKDRGTAVNVSFEYAGFDVSIDDEGKVTLVDFE